MPINLPPPPPAPVVCYLNTVNSHYQTPHWFFKKVPYPVTNYIIKIVLSFPLWFRSIVITGTMKFVHYKKELAPRALWSSLSQHWHPSCRNTSQYGGQMHATCCTQQCCDRLCWHVAIVWPGLKKTTTATETRTSLNKMFNERNKG